MIKKGDFVKINFTGYVDGEVFDTTNPEIAKKNGIQREAPGPIIICVGEKHLVEGVDEALIGKEKGSFKITVSPEKGFGKKKSELIQITPLNQFKKHKINPYPGMTLNIDGHYGVVKTISGGRVIVDYNHPLAGKDLEYEIEVLEIITDKKTQVESLLKLYGIPYDNIEIKEEEAIITTPLNPGLLEELQAKIKELTGLKIISFQNKEKPTKEKEEKKETKN